MRMSSKVSVVASSIVLLGVVLTEVGCSDADSVSAVNVTLREFSVTPDPSVVPEGTVTFHVTNMGTVDHELLVIRTNLAADALPTGADGSYQENGAGTTLVDEVEDIAPGQSKDLSVDLEDGNYVLVCNMVNVTNTGTFAHYALGMRAVFRVD